MTNCWKRLRFHRWYLLDALPFHINGRDYIYTLYLCRRCDKWKIKKRAASGSTFLRSRRR